MRVTAVAETLVVMVITDDGSFGSDKGVQGRDGEDDLEGTVVGMVSRVGVASEDFRKQVLGYGLATAHILYRMPDHRSLLQTYVWQNYDLFPKFPALQDFLAFWQEKLDGPLYSVTVAHSRLIKPAELRAIDGIFRLH